MYYKILKITPHQAGKMSAAIFASFALIFWPFFILMDVFARNSSSGGNLPKGFSFFFLAFPILYAVMGYLSTALMCWLYNLFSKRLGGIELNLVQNGEPATGVNMTAG